MEERRAVIDIGTNSVKLLVADVSGEMVTPIHEHGEQTRLGRGFYETHRLSAESIELTAKVVGQMTAEARSFGVASVRAFATSAARDSKNPQDLASAIRDRSGLDLEVTSGEQEAAWAFAGVGTNPTLSRKRILLVDVGGGSTEFILGHKAQCEFSQSFRLGTVRTIEALPHSDPPTTAELANYRDHAALFIRSQVKPSIDAARDRGSGSASSPAPRLVGCGGTAAIMAMLNGRMHSFDRDQIESEPLNLETITGWVEKLWRLPLVERQRLPGLPPPRADVMLAGAIIFEVILRELGFNELYISTRGLRFGAVLAE